MKLGADTPAVVTGGASGLGAAVVAHLESLGVPVGIIDRDIDSLSDKTAARADIADAAAVAEALEALRARQGQERLCVNCAGIAPSAKTVSRGAAHDAELFAKVVSVNLIGSFHVASQSALGMTALEPREDDERGVIINTSSIAAFEGQMGQVAYSASKGGVAAMTLPMARDLAKSGIRVVAIAPGIFKTPMVSGMPDTVQEALASISEFPRRLGKPEEFAELVETIARVIMFNGETLRLDAATRLPAR